MTIFWFRRDLRLHDNAGFYHALKSNHPVLPLFIFDQNILNDLEDKKDARVAFIHAEIKRLQLELKKQGSSIIVKYGTPEKVWEALLKEEIIHAVYTNHDYEPYAKERDAKIKNLLEEKGIPFHTYKDQVIFENLEVTKDDGTPYVVFTPYSRKWREKLTTRMSTMLDSKGEQIPVSFYLKPYPNAKYFDNLYQSREREIPSLSDMKFDEPTEINIPDKTVRRGLIKTYDKTRDYPAQSGTSRLGIHFRFGTISIRDKVLKAQGLNETFVNELIWRDFYAMILANYPKVVNNAFREKYDRIPWRNNEKEFKAWCEGKTGYPMVDAGMRELNTTGYMHNRVRMVTASFLTKHLLIDWRWGEAYFAKKLLDYDLASNNGGWQWAAGSGTDAAPYFRIFNPESQMKKFDKEKKYIKQWIPEYGTDDYPTPIVNHKEARERCLKTYKEALN